MKTTPIDNIFPAYGKAAAECLQSVKEVFSFTHEEEVSVAHECVETQDKVVAACLDRLNGGDLSSEEESVLWEQISKASDRQAETHQRQIDSGKESRFAIVLVGGAIVLGVVAIANPELVKSFAGTVGKKFLTKAPKAFAA